MFNVRKIRFCDKTLTFQTDYLEERWNNCSSKIDNIESKCKIQWTWEG